MEKAPAKINLALDVLFKRPDGYHEVEMIMTTVDLADRIELKNNHIQILSIIDLFRMMRNLAYQAHLF
jgi:4-diphosphocytidyl-2-C-methyl-D-erythritol kinase